MAYNIANVYETLGDREQRKYWLARAAVNELGSEVLFGGAAEDMWQGGEQQQ